MLLEVTIWLADMWVQLWNMFLNGGYIGLSIILIPILRKLSAVMREFTN